MNAGWLPLSVPGAGEFFVRVHGARAECRTAAEHERALVREWEDLTKRARGDLAPFRQRPHAEWPALLRLVCDDRRLHATWPDLATYPESVHLQGATAEQVAPLLSFDLHRSRCTYYRLACYRDVDVNVVTKHLQAHRFERAPDVAVRCASVGPSGGPVFTGHVMVLLHCTRVLASPARGFELETELTAHLLALKAEVDALPLPEVEGHVPVSCGWFESDVSGDVVRVRCAHSVLTATASPGATVHFAVPRHATLFPTYGPGLATHSFTLAL